MTIIAQSQEAEVAELLNTILPKLLDFIASADDVNASRVSKSAEDAPSLQLAALRDPADISSSLKMMFKEQGGGVDGVEDLVQRVLDASANTWDHGFMHKLYSGTNAPGVASELTLAVLNTNLHVYTVSPALSVIEKATTKALASLFGLRGPYAGGISQPGGSASNLTSVMIARHQAFPHVKSQGWQHERPLLFTSQESHYSLRKAAEVIGIGAQAVWSIKCDQTGRMIPSELQLALSRARQQGFHVFYVNATAGTTVRGAFDPIKEISEICRENGIWLHVDASLGGGLIFSNSDVHRNKFNGIDRANSITMNPHKMLGVPVTCSFLLGDDLRKFWAANTVDAEYLFHGTPSSPKGSISASPVDTNNLFDLADLTPQCGRKGDSFKLALGWVYYGRSGYGRYVDAAMNSAAHLARLVENETKLSLVGSTEPECVQVCFYYKLGGPTSKHTYDCNSHMSATISEALPTKGFMVDYAPGPEGKMLRVVTNGSTEIDMLGRLVDTIVDLGHISEAHHVCK